MTFPSSSSSYSGSSVAGWQFQAASVGMRSSGRFTKIPLVLFLGTYDLLWPRQREQKQQVTRVEALRPSARLSVFPPRSHGTRGRM